MVMVLFVYIWNLGTVGSWAWGAPIYIIALREEVTWETVFVTALLRVHNTLFFKQTAQIPIMLRR